jgi:phenylacetic acid degradation protein paaN
MSLYEKHKNTIDQAAEALQSRAFYAYFPEHPKAYAEEADAEGRKSYMGRLGQKFDLLLQDGAEGWVGDEVSPYTQEALGIQYPSFSVETLVERAKASFPAWRKASPETRAGILSEALDRFKARFFENAYATMHTTGQGYMMAFQASGPHAADRALEALVAGYLELKRFPDTADWVKPMGKFDISLKKTWKVVPKGIGLVIGCSTFPTWNSLPGLFATLITGNPALVKPHPGAVLPIALVVAEIQAVLKENGFDTNTCQLAVDTVAATNTKALAEHPDVKIIDYTGNAHFGNYLEGLSGKMVFTEKTGVNSIIIDSVPNLKDMIGNISFSLLLYSGQMCTAPQNIYVPAQGFESDEGHISVDEFVAKLNEAILGLAHNPKAGPFVLGAIQNPATVQRLEEAKKLGAKVVLESGSIENGMFKNARTATPMLMEVGPEQKELYSQELFGPIAFIVKVSDVDEALAIATELGQKAGAMSCGAYTTSETVKENIMEAMALAGTPVSFNLGNGIYINQTAAFSDFHGTGANPAANASFTDTSFVANRFNRVGFREPV